MATYSLQSGAQVSDEKAHKKDKTKAKKIRRRRTTGRVAGTTQSAFASQSMSDVLQQKAAEQSKQSEAGDSQDDTQAAAEEGKDEKNEKD